MLDYDGPRPHSELPLDNLKDLEAFCRQVPDGAFVELGVFRGGSAWVLHEVAHERNLTVHLFDTFTGIPYQDKGDPIAVGQFSNVNLDEIKANLPEAHFHIGLFPDTWPEDMGPISFAHIDCDQYRGCKSAIELIWPLMVPGGIIAFDDYPGFDGIRKAVDDFFPSVSYTSNKVPYVVKK